MCNSRKLHLTLRVCVHTLVRMCVWQRGREREGEKEREKHSGRHNLCQLCDVEDMRPRRVLWVAVTASPPRACPISDFIGSSSDADTPTNPLSLPAHFFHHIFFHPFKCCFFFFDSCSSLHCSAPHHISAPPVCCTSIFPPLSHMPWDKPYPHFLHLFLAILSRLILFSFECNCAVKGLNRSEPLRALEVLYGHIKFVSMWHTSSRGLLLFHTTAALTPFKCTSKDVVVLNCVIIKSVSHTVYW